MGQNAVGAGIAVNAKLTSDNFNNAFMACNGDTGSEGRIKSDKYFCNGKTTQSPGPNMNITADTGIYEFVGTATFPTGNTVDSIAAGENGQGLTLVNNSDVPITININPDKPFVLEPGCMVDLTYCSSTWTLGSGNATELCCDVEQVGHGFSALDAVAADNAGAWVAADATDSSLLASHVVVSVIDADNFKVQAFGPYEFTNPHGLNDCFYFQDPATPGASMDTTPQVVNTYNNVLYRPINATKIEILAGTRPYLIGGAGGNSGAPTVPIFINSTAGAADAGKGVELDAKGILDCSFRPIDVTYAYDGSNTAAAPGSSTLYAPTNVTNGMWSTITGSTINILRTGLYRVEVDVTVQQPIGGTNGAIALTLIGASGGPRVINDHLDPDFAASYFKGYTIIDATAGDTISMSLFNTAGNAVNVGSSAQESIISITKLQGS